jgi:hypothetical protein
MGVKYTRQRFLDRLTAVKTAWVPHLNTKVTRTLSAKGRSCSTQNPLFWPRTADKAVLPQDAPKKTIAMGVVCLGITAIATNVNGQSNLGNEVSRALSLFGSAPSQANF